MENKWQISIRFITLTFLLVMQISGGEARSKFQPDIQFDREGMFLRTRKEADWIEEENCGVHKVEQIHFVMDRVCEMCHEMFSHELNSLRAQCRSNCFDNKYFRNCLTLFSETRAAGSPSERRLPEEPVMTLQNF